MHSKIFNRHNIYLCFEADQDFTPHWPQRRLQNVKVEVSINRAGVDVKIRNILNRT